MSIEGLVGSKFDDTLTGNSLDNVLAGGLGNDILNGKAGSIRSITHAIISLIPATRLPRPKYTSD